MVYIFPISGKTFNCENDFHVCFLALLPLQESFFFFFLISTLAALGKDFSPQLFTLSLSLQ